MAPEEPELPHDSFPPWARYVEAAIPVSLAIAVSHQHDALFPLRWPAVFAFAAAAPWVIGLVVEGHRPLLRRLGSLVVLGSVAVLVVNPVELDFAPFFLVFLVAHEGLVTSKWESSTVLAGSVLLMVGVEISGRYDGSFIWILGMVIAWAGGCAIRSQLTLVADLEAAQSALAERAVAEERQRIAREIHDVVAHTLSVTMLYVTGARLAIRRDPKEAEEALLAAERLGRESLQEIRRTVGLLGPDVSGAAAPMPTVADVPDLVDEFRAAGLEVDLTLVGDATDLSPATGLAIYRIAQESLTNVVKHAPGRRADVRLVIEPARASLRVRNQLVGAETNGDADGLGVRGMQQRVELLGGTLRADARDGEWVVDVDVPVEQAVGVIRLLLVDDQQLVREGLRRILHPDEGFEIVGECADGAAALEAAARLDVDVVVMDIRMKGMDGVEATRRLRERPDAPPVLVLTTFDDDDVLSGALRAGAAGFVLKDAPGEELIRSARAIAAGEAWLDQSVTARVLATYRSASPASAEVREQIEQLTPRELDVLRLVGRGATNAEIATELIVSEATVKSHIGHIFTKLDRRDRAAAIVFAFDHGLVAPHTGT